MTQTTLAKLTARLGGRPKRADCDEIGIPMLDEYGPETTKSAHDMGDPTGDEQWRQERRAVLDEIRRRLDWDRP